MSGSASNTPKPASSPCLAEDVQELADGSAVVVDAEQARDVARWRKAERARLLGLRQALSVAARAEMDARIIEALDPLLESARSVGFYWPFRGEPDLRPLIGRLTEAGTVCALPVVEGKGMPLGFRTYRPGDRLERGVWDIPVPGEGEAVAPELLLSPVVGFDAAGFRLGYGGGFFDRTVAARTPPPRLIGVGYEIARIPTIFPQAHDKPMEAVVTEAGRFLPEA